MCSSVVNAVGGAINKSASFVGKSVGKGVKAVGNVAADAVGGVVDTGFKVVGGVAEEVGVPKGIVSGVGKVAKKSAQLAANPLGFIDLAKDAGRATKNVYKGMTAGSEPGQAPVAESNNDTQAQDATTPIQADYSAIRRNFTASRKRTGRSASIKTSPLGDTSQAVTQKKTLLGY